jgi:heavy metal sensor kinase
MFTTLKKFFKSTRFKITFWYSALFLLLEIFIGVIIYVHLHTSLRNQLDHSLERQAEVIYNLVSESKVDLTDFKPDSLYTSADDFVYDLIYEAVVFNSRNTYVQVQLNKKIIFKTDNLKKQQLVFPEVKSNSAKTLYRESTFNNVEIRAAYFHKGKYKIIVAFPLELIDETLTSLTDIYIVLGPLFFFISFGGGFMLSRRSLKRMDAIIKKTEIITALNLDERIEGEEFNDEYGRLAKTLNSMINRIKVAVDYMNQFSVSASHELKTPLTILRGEIEVALKTAKTFDDLKEILLSNYEETLRLINIVDKLFFLSKLDNQLLSLKKEKVSLLEFLETSALPMGYLGEKKNIKILLDVEEDFDFEIDAGLMKEAMTNLIENAIKYGDENQSIKVSGRKDKKEIRISVANKGLGIPPEEIKKIFERFYRVDSSRNRTSGGVGLGLSVVSSIVKWHGGKVDVKSVVGKETEFTIILNSSNQ